jgi:hypothetical protein
MITGEQITHLPAFLDEFARMSSPAWASISYFSNIRLSVRALL